MKSRRLSVLFLAGGLMASAHAMAGVTDAAMISNTCAGCHGTDGASQGEAPTIAGLSEQYLAETMKSYKEGKRYSTIMGRIAKGYDDKQIQAMSSFYASKPWVNANQKVDSALAAKGKSLHMSKGCVGCHGAKGISPMANTPRLTGQYIDYAVIQMKDYQDPSRAIPPSAMAMRGMFAGMSEADLRALAHFYASEK